MTYQMDVQNFIGNRILRVFYIPKGEYNPNNNVRKADTDGIVEFYDLYHKSEDRPNGQFTGGYYYLSTFMNIDYTDLNLCDYSDGWNINKDTVRLIQAWLKNIQ